MYARRTAPPGVLLESPRTIGGRDLEKGGTWMGVTEAGLFVGVTNQRTYGLHDDALLSRGQLVLDALARGTVDGVLAYLATVDARQYNAFNLLFGDARALHVAYARRDARDVAVEALAHGTWILANDRIGSPEFPKTARAAELARPLASLDGDALADAAHTLLADHELPSLERVPPPPAGSPFPHALLQQLQAICIHTPIYGTRSSAFVVVGETRVEHYLYADGSACKSSFTEYAHLLRA